MRQEEEAQRRKESPGRERGWAGETWRRERQRDRSEVGKKLDERKWAGAVKEGHAGEGGDRAGAEPCGGKRRGRCHL